MNDLAKIEPDWSDIEQAYRVGREPLRAIAERNGISHTAIRKRAEKEGWVRDLSGKIKAKAEILVSKDAVSKQVSMETVSERDIVEANAELQANVIRSERKDITRYRGLVAKLFAELEAITDGLELMERLGDMMSAADEAGIDKLNEIYRKVIALPGRVDMAKKLVETLEKLINAERRVFNIKDDELPGERQLVGVVRLVPLSRATAQVGQDDEDLG